MSPPPNDPAGYTAAMVARVADAPLAAIRRWARRGYFSPRDAGTAQAYAFADLRVAKMLAELLSNGASLARIDRLVDDLRTGSQNPQGSLCDWEFTIEDGQIVVMRNGQRTDPGGQQLIAFQEEQVDTPSVAFPSPVEDTLAGEQRELAESLAAHGDHQAAAEAYRSLLLSGQGAPNDQFALAECLYLLGDLTAARERLLVCLEADEGFWEARLMLGCVYAQLDSLELAESSLLGALDLSPDCPEALLALADLYDRMHETSKANQLRSRFVESAPAGPWIEEARSRLGEDC